MNNKTAWLKRLKHVLHLEPKTKEDLIQVLREAHHQSLIDAETLGMMEGVLLLAHMKVRDIMLPKKQMIYIKEDHTLLDVLNIVTQSGHSRFPVISENKGDVIGILHAKDLLCLQHADDDTSKFDVRELVRQASCVPESKRLDLLLSEFRITRNHMAIVVDEYGSVSGFVTLEDIIEQIIGEIEDEFDIDEEAYIKSHGDYCYILKAHTPVDEFNALLNTKLDETSYDTVGGVIMARFGHLPKRGEQTHIDGLSFKIIHADARRIKLIECIDERHLTSNNHPKSA